MLEYYAAITTLFLAVLGSLQNLSSPTVDWTWATAVKAQNLKPLPPKKPLKIFLKDIFKISHKNTHEIIWGLEVAGCKTAFRWLQLHQFSSVQSLSCVRLFATPWIATCQASLSITNSWSSLRFMSMESVMPSSQLILCRPLLLLPPIPPSISLFQCSSHEVAKVLEFQL